MSARHTPGPWDCTGCLFPEDGMGGVYYRIQADGIDARAANARAIAAVPELIDALYQYFNDLRYPPAADSVERRLAMIEALLAKIGGEA